MSQGLTLADSTSTAMRRAASSGLICGPLALREEGGRESGERIASPPLEQPATRGVCKDRPRSGGALSGGLAGCQTQARQVELTVLAVAKRQFARHDQRAKGAQPGDGRARFVEPPHMAIARRESAV